MYIIINDLANSVIMKRFLNQQLNRIASPPPGSVLRVTVILGNEAADADSIVSAICLAYLKSTEQGSEGPVFVPVAAVERPQLRLRRDVQLLLGKIGLGLDDVICKGDVQFKELRESNDVKLILVDQNTTPSCAESCADLTEEILDHHLDAGAFPWVVGAKRNIAYDGASSRALVGSACSLVAENYVTSGYISEEVATLLLGVIALDTFDMDPVINKGTPRDAEAMAALQQLVPSIDRHELFVLLRDAKLNIDFWRSLSVNDAIYLDYKLFLSESGCRNGLSSVLLPVEEFIAKETAEKDIVEIINIENLDIFAAMALIMTPEGTRRELLCVSKSQRSADDLCSYLTGPSCTSAGLTLRFPPMSFPPGGYITSIFDQKNVAYSRKQMAKYFIEFDKH